MFDNGGNLEKSLYGPARDHQLRSVFIAGKKKHQSCTEEAPKLHV